MALNNKTFFRIGFVCVLIFIVIASYLWYLYFHNYEGEMLGKNIALEFINSGHIDYVNAQVNDPEEIIPTYYFRVKNNIDKVFKYEKKIKKDTKLPSTFSEDELMYELKLDNRVIKNGLLSSIQNNVLDANTISGNKINDYSLRIWLADNAIDDANKSYHYVVNFREK